MGGALMSKFIASEVALSLYNKVKWLGGHTLLE